MSSSSSPVISNNNNKNNNDLCFNTNCLRTPVTKNGWRRRTGDFVRLCDPCATTFGEGKFCETFHVNASGWRSCESCGKQIHCGCIVSFHMFVLLDAGGIECIACARKSFILTPNPAWPPPSLHLSLHSEQNASNKSRCHISRSGPVPWRQAPSLFGSSGAQPDIQPKMPIEVDVTGSVHRLTTCERYCVGSSDKKNPEVSDRIINGSLKLVASDKHGIILEPAKCHVKLPLPPSFLEKETHTPHMIFPFSSTTLDVMKDSVEVPCTLVPQPITLDLNGKHCSGQCETESSSEVQTCNGRHSGDTGQGNKYLTRYYPRTNDHELQQIFGTSKSVITPLFEKRLSVSDTGYLGRLVIPKKCAETFFPPITQGEVLPLKFQDVKGNDWILQFRFWPNIKSRMYILEGFNACILSMNLQAGDVGASHNKWYTVTFNRVEPEGKFVMGFRKSLMDAPSNQDAEYVGASNGSSTGGDASATKSNDQASSCCENRKGECMVDEIPGEKSIVGKKRKNGILCSNYDRFEIEKKDHLEIELTREQAQGLLCPPLNHVPHVVVIEGSEFEEYEEAPVIGRPTIFAVDSMGEDIQWAQCEDCLKWRKVPADALLSARWTCSANSWDPERSSCSKAQELTTKQVEELLPRKQVASNNAVNPEPDSFVELDGPIQDEGYANPSLSQCKSIVCNQPPRGESIVHVETCMCYICLATKRRVEFLTQRDEKKQSEKEHTGQKLTENKSSLKQVLDGEKQTCLATGSTLIPKMGNGNCDGFNTTRSSLSSFKGQFDLNIHPDGDEEWSPGSDSGELTKLIKKITAGRYLSPRVQF